MKNEERQMQQLVTNYFSEQQERQVNDRLRSSILLLKNQEKIRQDPIHYYNEERDIKDVLTYYKDVNHENKSATELFYLFHELVKTTHKNQLPYSISKDRYLYPWVDLQPDGSVKSIYSGEKEDPQKLIQEDFLTNQKRYVQFQSLLKQMKKKDSTILKKMKIIERELKYNTEHIVPQSWFHAREPMKGDLHHLFVCHPTCNSRRSNYPYADFSFYQPELPTEKIRNHCGIVMDGRFEPEYGKGAAARAMLYFLLRYPKAIKKSFLEQIDLRLLIHWHEAFPVTIYEKHRNQAIYHIQGNRNPFIDFPDLVHEIRF
jgi:deoxyribonuclease I